MIRIISSNFLIPQKPKWAAWIAKEMGFLHHRHEELGIADLQQTPVAEWTTSEFKEMAQVVMRYFGITVNQDGTRFINKEKGIEGFYTQAEIDKSEVNPQALFRIKTYMWWQKVEACAPASGESLLAFLHRQFGSGRQWTSTLTTHFPRLAEFSN